MATANPIQAVPGDPQTRTPAGTIDARGVYAPKHHVRFVTATALFDGHDASINIIRRMLQTTGVEVVHLGHNRSVAEVVDAAICEDAQGIAISSYQGGHVEYFKYMVDLLAERGAGHVRVFGGGGGVIIPEEIAELEGYGVCRIYSPEDGMKSGLQGIINDMVGRADFATFSGDFDAELTELGTDDPLHVGRLITATEMLHEGMEAELAKFQEHVASMIGERKVPVVGITGTGGAGKSSLTDELIFRLLNDSPTARVAVLSIDPSRKKTGGALLGDRIRMNSLRADRVYMRSLATRHSRSEISACLGEAISVVKAAGYDLVIVETAGIGQGDAEIVPHVDVTLYVMTAEYGAASQLEKIEMLDYADIAVINKFERRGSGDALRDVRKQLQRNQMLGTTSAEKLPVYGTIAARFNDDGVTALYAGLVDAIREKTGVSLGGSTEPTDRRTPSTTDVIIPGTRTRYLSEIADTVRAHKDWAARQADIARRIQAVDLTTEGLEAGEAVEVLARRRDELAERLAPECASLLARWPEICEQYSGEEFVYRVRDREIRVPLTRESLSQKAIPKVCLPRYEDRGELLKWLLLENLPGSFPYTAGCFPFKRTAEDPTRMFAGEGDPFRTNRRFHFVSADFPAKRLSTAFDSATLYGADPDPRPDIYGKVGTSGVSICTLDDMKVLYSGFDLTSPTTSVSMTINGPAPMILAMFLNTAIDQQVERFEEEHGREPDAEEAAKIRRRALRDRAGVGRDPGRGWAGRPSREPVARHGLAGRSAILA